MRIDLLGVDSPQWTAVLDRTRHDVYHLPGYVRLMAEIEHGEPVALHVRDGDRSLLLPLVVRPIAGSTRDAMSPYGYPGPLLTGTDDPTFAADALTAALPVLRSSGIVSLFVRMHPILDPSPAGRPGTLVFHGETVAVDLTLPPETHWTQTRHDHRRAINRARRLGHVAEIDATWSEYAAFRRLYAATMARVRADAYYHFDEAYFDGLREALGDHLHLCVVRIDGAVAAAALFTEASGIVQYHLSGVGDAYIRERPSKLMIDFVRAWARERGDRLLHLGGGVGAAADTLMEFKSGFSPLRFKYHTLRVVVDPAEYERLMGERGPTVDPMSLTGFFPGYRSEGTGAAEGEEPSPGAIER